MPAKKIQEAFGQKHRQRNKVLRTGKWMRLGDLSAFAKGNCRGVGPACPGEHHVAEWKGLIDLPVLPRLLAVRDKRAGRRPPWRGSCLADTSAMRRRYGRYAPGACRGDSSCRCSFRRAATALRR